MEIIVQICYSTYCSTCADTSRIVERSVRFITFRFEKLFRQSSYFNLAEPLKLTTLIFKNLWAKTLGSIYLSTKNLGRKFELIWASANLGDNKFGHNFSRLRGSALDWIIPLLRVKIAILISVFMVMHKSQRISWPYFFSHELNRASYNDVSTNYQKWLITR